MAAGNTGGSLNTHSLTTLAKYLPTLADNVTNGIGLFRYYRQRKLLDVRPLEGPEEIIPLDVGVSDYALQYWDDADVLTLEPTEELIEARVGHYNATAGTYISQTEAWENSGPFKIRDLWQTKLNALERNLQIGLAKGMVGSNASITKRAPGIRDLMGGGSPTASFSSSQSTYEGLAPTAVNNATDGTTNLWAVHVKITTVLGPNNQNISNDLLDAALDLQKWMGAPKLGICDSVYYTNFAKMLRGAGTAGYPANYQGNYSADRPMGSFDPAMPRELAYNGSTLIYDPYIAVPSDYTSGTDGHCNYIDPQHFKIVVDGRANFSILKPRPLAADDEQLIRRHRVLFRWTTVCNKRNAHLIHVLDL